MTFVLQQSPLFWWPVTVLVPSDEKPGTFEKHTFRAQFENIGRDEARRLRDELLALPAEEYEAREDDLMRRVFRGWEDVATREGEAVPFTPSNFDAAWQNSWFRIGVAEAWRKAINGEEARRGN
jgi:hypothetical protein